MAPDIDHGRLLTILGILALLILAYSLVIIQQILLGVFLVFGMFGIYLFFVFIQILDRIATALERLVDEKRHE